MPTRMLHLVFAGYVTVIIVLSVLPGTPTPPAGDKLAHFGAYFIMAGLGMPLVHTARRQLALFILLVMLGGVLEFLQGFVPYRDPSLWDEVANAIGVAAGTTLIALLRTHRPRVFARIFRTRV